MDVCIVVAFLRNATANDDTLRASKSFEFRIRFNELCSILAYRTMGILNRTVSVYFIKKIRKY